MTGMTINQFNWFGNIITLILLSLLLFVTVRKIARSQSGDISCTEKNVPLFTVLPSLQKLGKNEYNYV